MIFFESHTEIPEEIILDVDATDDPLHGNQEGNFFHGYYKAYCYLPLYIFGGEHLLCARLRTAKKYGVKGTVEEVRRIVQRIRAVWADTKIIVCGDSGFCREDNDVNSLIGLAKNNRLAKEIEEEMALAKALYQCSCRASLVFKDFCYKTLKTWRWNRRVVGKAEHLAKGSNPKFSAKFCCQRLKKQLDEKIGLGSVPSILKCHTRIIPVLKRAFETFLRNLDRSRSLCPVLKGAYLPPAWE